MALSDLYQGYQLPTYQPPWLTSAVADDNDADMDDSGEQTPTLANTFAGPPSAPTQFQYQAAQFAAPTVPTVASLSFPPPPPTATPPNTLCHGRPNTRRGSKTRSQSPKSRRHTAVSSPTFCFNVPPMNEQPVPSSPDAGTSGLRDHMGQSSSFSEVTGIAGFSSNDREELITRSYIMRQISVSWSGALPRSSAKFTYSPATRTRDCLPASSAGRNIETMYKELRTEQKVVKAELDKVMRRSPFNDPAASRSG
ncbi:hypothetical protein SISSUDRAFT_1037671 [Sistotremastrum suecicum HHB10207 ss-3]|uniref:Uncharacterized protein n=1 Tax=Sistotremastrum suecicum HHB10207 ss-3 TaxID=1314776 RepID=A0A165XTI3_9AGAM|nr:hypothetical protein SISSUDRAFT_1037671 [Sistotremastrum suecicum HHB10207 ss-3]